jgi:hypothetical protein
MPQEPPHTDFDQEIAHLQALATALTDTLTLPMFTYPALPALSLPGIAVVTNEDQGGPNADA